MLKLQLFGTRQKVFGMLRTTFGTVCCICLHSRISFWQVLPVHLPWNSMGWKSALLKSQHPWWGANSQPRSIFGWDLAEVCLFWIWMDGVLPPCSTGNMQGCNSLSSISFSRVQRIWAFLTKNSFPWAKSLKVTEPFHPLQACRCQKESKNHHLKYREGGNVPSLCWAGLQIKDNLVMRSHQMMINKQSFLCLIHLSRVERFPRDRKGWSTGTWSVGLPKSHLMDSGVLSVTGAGVKGGLSSLLLHGALHLSQKTQPGGLTPS